VIAAERWGWENEAEDKEDGVWMGGWRRRRRRRRRRREDNDDIIESALYLLVLPALQLLLYGP
jgi:hypothetical protein